MLDFCTCANQLRTRSFDLSGSVLQRWSPHEEDDGDGDGDGDDDDDDDGVDDDDDDDDDG
eukprot:206684-Karenia_brevis.AAC.1